MIRFSVIAFLGVVLLWAGLRRLQQISGSSRLLDWRSVVLAVRIGDADAWFTLFVTLVGALQPLVVALLTTVVSSTTGRAQSTTLRPLAEATRSIAERSSPGSQRSAPTESW